MAISILDPELVSQIAAGEVVERPASVQKELIENALDAGASRIDVSIEGGGIGLVEVADNGRGMSPDDARLCIQRHATSKLKAFSDLEEIASYGFRGEALPSIASVSKLSIRTRDASADEGTLIVAPGTLKAQTSTIGSPVGTVVTVRDLFFNVPARRKFLRSTNTESGHVGEVLMDAALSRFDVSFSLKRDGRVTKDYPRVTSARQRVEQVLGESDLSECRGERGPLSVDAYLCSPERARRGSSGLKVFVNGRPVRERSLFSTIAHAFGDRLERGRYPRGVVFLTLPGSLVDVNVHPQKTEVRFASARAVLDAVHSVIARTMTSGAGFAPARDVVPYQATERSTLPQVVKDGASELGGQRYKLRGAGALQVSEPSRKSQELPRPATSVATTRPETKATPPQTDEPPQSESWRGLRFIGQTGPGYLLCESREGVVVVDQHAADELRLQGLLDQALNQGKLGAQALLFPETVRLAPDLIEAASQKVEALSRLGLDLRARSKETVSMHSVPRLFARMEPQVILQTVETHLLASSKSDEEALRLTLAELACVGARKLDAPITRNEADSLLRDLRNSDLRLPCRHGGPLLFKLSFSDLARRKGER